MANRTNPLSGGITRHLIDRRVFLLGAASLLGGCATQADGPRVEPLAYAPTVDPFYQQMYGAIPDEKFPIPAADISRIDPQYLRQEVAYSGPEQPGTVVVDPNARFLYLVREGGRAMRYGVGVGREGFGWSGGATIARKAKWPTWTPPREMIEREPELVKYANGMKPGLDNPLGARALYLFQGGRDTLYRVHGTQEEWSIGRAVSSGCIRLLNQDVIDLYSRVPTGSRIVVRASKPPSNIEQV
ncbi:L,D-transpeptidase [Afifella pfennigii]|uniref:L,D-transpeptidase n=1 Tax=Afifella pfennigii TaxID=209897 RepID=UPI000B166C8A|nr:L,D-transpeptidase [Afifella pfennigii]